MTLRRLVSLVVPAVLLVTGVARAEAKLGYVDMQRALMEIEEGKVAKAKLKAQFDAKQKDLDARQAELKKDNDNLEAAAREGLLKEDKLQQKRDELQIRVHPPSISTRSARRQLPT